MYKYFLSASYSRCSLQSIKFDYSHSKHKNTVNSRLQDQQTASLKLSKDIVPTPPRFRQPNNWSEDLNSSHGQQQQHPEQALRHLPKIKVQTEDKGDAKPVTGERVLKDLLLKKHLSSGDMRGRARRLRRGGKIRDWDWVAWYCGLEGGIGSDCSASENLGTGMLFVVFKT